MFVIVLDDVPEKGIWLFGGISNELRIIACASLSQCVHYNDADICKQVFSFLVKCGIHCHIDNVASVCVDIFLNSFSREDKT